MNTIKNSKNIKICPACRYVQDTTNKKCVACSLVFEKYMQYTPIKISMNKIISNSEISEIRKMENQLKMENNSLSKMQILLNCFNNKILDLAAFHFRNKNDINSLNTISDMLKINIHKIKKDKIFIFKPAFLLSLTFVCILLVISFLLRSFVS